MLGSAKSEHPMANLVVYRPLFTPWMYFRRIPTHVITIPQRHKHTDGRTDRRLDVAIPRSA